MIYLALQADKDQSANAVIPITKPNLKFMNIIKTSLLTLLLVLPITKAVAEVNADQTVNHLQKAIAEIIKSDFNAAQVELKAARNTSDKINGDASVLKQANDHLLQGQILTKKGEIAQATDSLNKAITLYQSF